MLGYFLITKGCKKYVCLQGPPYLFLKCCQPLEILTYFEKGLRCFNTGNMWLQSYHPSIFENDSTPSKVEAGPNAVALTSAVMAKTVDLLGDLQTACNFPAL